MGNARRKERCPTAVPLLLCCCVPPLILTTRGHLHVLPANEKNSTSNRRVVKEAWRLYGRVWEGREVVREMGKGVRGCVRACVLCVPLMHLGSPPHITSGPGGSKYVCPYHPLDVASKGRHLA